MFKTTFSLDQEFYYYLFNIALIELQNGKGVLNLNQALKSSITFLMNNKDSIDLKSFEVQHIIKTDGNNYIMYYNGEDDNKLFLNEFSEELSKLSNFRIKNNQIIKSIVVFYYNHLLKQNNQNI